MGLDEILKAGFEDEKIPNPIPNYELRYSWFVEEFLQYNAPIPDNLKQEFEALKIICGKEENEELSKMLQKFIVSVNDEIPMPEIVLSICDENGQNKRMIMTRQNISSVTARAKVGKTFLVKLIVSSVLKRGVFQNRLHSELPKGKDKILYIDTEQAKFHVRLGLSQIKTILGDDAHEMERLTVYQFDSVSTLKRREYTKYLIYTFKPDFVILDGVSDLCLNTNDIVEADELVTELRIWATENNCHILNVIHQNPSDFTDKMKGHLGTKLQDKSEIVIGVSIDKDDENLRIVQSLASRNQKPDPFVFTINDGVPEIPNDGAVYVEKTKSKKQAKKSDLDLYKILSIVFEKNTTNERKFLRYSEIVSHFMYYYQEMFKETISERTTKALMVEFTAKEFLSKKGEPRHAEFYLKNLSTTYKNPENNVSNSYKNINPPKELLFDNLDENQTKNSDENGIQF